MAQETPEEEEVIEIKEEPLYKTRPEALLAMLQIESDDLEHLENFYRVVCVPILEFVNDHDELHVVDPNIFLLLSYIKKLIDERRDFIHGENGLQANCKSVEDLQGPIGSWKTMVLKITKGILLFIYHYYLYSEPFLGLCERFPELDQFIREKQDEFGASLIQTLQGITQYNQNLLNWINLLYDLTEKKTSNDAKTLVTTREIIEAKIQIYQAATSDGIPTMLEFPKQKGRFFFSLANIPSTYGKIVNVEQKTPDNQNLGFFKGKVISKISLHNQKNEKQISDEIEANKRLHHINILKMKIYEQDELFHYLMYPDTEHSHLSDVMKKNIVLSEEQARPIFRELIQGIQHMHSNGVIHGQLSPETIVFYKNHVRISDFSLCHLAMPGESKAKNKGPLIYMAPETFTKHTFDGAANDIWSCGIILYEMLSGSNPFKRTGSRPNSSQTQTRATKNKTITGKLSVTNKVKRGDIVYPKSFSSSVIFLLKGILNKVPHERLTVEQILSHNWLLKVTEVPVKYTINPEISQSSAKKKTQK